MNTILAAYAFEPLPFSELLAACGLLIGASIFTWKRLLRFLRFFQQEEYSNVRFISWIVKQRAFDTLGSAAAGILALLVFMGLPALIASLVGLGALIAMAMWEDDPRIKGKVRLVMTERAQRIYSTAFGLYALTAAAIAAATFQQPAVLWLAQIALFQLTPLWLMAACQLLSRKEMQRQNNFLLEAKTIYAAAAPFVIGITGSYGKTSTKDALGQILQITLGPTFWPAKGINTPMGITREIRTHLRSGMKYAVIEMGAYGRGSIDRLCKLTPPHAALITCVGNAHLERFGSEENILLTKAELAQAVPANGLLVVNGDNKGCRRIAHENPKKTTLLYGLNKDLGELDCWVSSWKTTPEGTLFTLHWQNKAYEGFTPLLGATALSNAVGAFTMACALGSQPDYALGVIHNLTPVDNRLQMQKEGRITYLKDAYNSNPVGFAAALEVMAALPGKRRLVMTPGMIELGEEQRVQNEKVGRLAAVKCDAALIVGMTNRHALTKGLLEGGMQSGQVFFCETREKAFALLHSMAQEDDIVLIENDLVDLYEPVRF